MRSRPEPNAGLEIGIGAMMNEPRFSPFCFPLSSFFGLDESAVWSSVWPAETLSLLTAALSLAGVGLGLWLKPVVPVAMIQTATRREATSARQKAEGFGAPAPVAAEKFPPSLRRFITYAYTFPLRVASHNPPS